MAAGEGSSSRKVWPIVAAIIIGVLVIVLLRAVTSSRSADRDESSPLPVDTSKCTMVEVAASSEKAKLLAGVASTYNAEGRSVDGACVQVSVTSVASGAALDALGSTWDDTLGPRPDVWTPASSSWLRLLTQRTSVADRPDLVPADAPSIAQTPLVLAMPRPMAEALGWPKEQLGWSDVVRLAQDPQGWGSVGHPEWGQFKLGKTNPLYSTSGLNATVGAFYAATGVSSDLTEAQVVDPKVQDFVRGVESSVVHYGDTTLTFLSNLADAARDGKGMTYVSAVTVEEKSVLDYNSGNPTGDPALAGQQSPPQVPLVAVYPKEGTLVSDNPYAVLQGDWVTPAKRAGALDFLTYLHDGRVQEQFQAAGFRSFEGKPGSVLSVENGMLPEGAVSVIAPPAPPVMEKVLSSWQETRKRARALLVVDVSGSMSQPEAGGSRLDLAKQAALHSLDEFADDDEVGLWIFSTNRSGSAPYLELVPVGRVGDNRQALKDRISNLVPDGGTGLYATARAARSAMQGTYDPSRINAVVLLTDGRNEYPADNDLSGLVRSFQESSETDPVRVFTIGYGKDADMPTLERISKASAASAYNAQDASRIEKVFDLVVSNF